MEKESYDADNYMVAWDAPFGGTTPRQVEVGEWPDQTGWSDAYELTTGFCDSFFHELSEEEQAQALLNLAADMMFDGLAAQDVLREFSKIRAWREMGVLLPAGHYSRAFLPGSGDWNPYNP